jgi:hypothetical protein
MSAMRGVTCAVVAAALGVACATKVASTTPEGFTTVDPSLVVATLGPDDAARLCFAVKLFGATALTDSQTYLYDCALFLLDQGVTGGVNPAQCKSDRNGCQTTPRAPLDYRSCNLFYGASHSCALTVGELTACVFAAANGDVALASAMSTICEQPPPSPQHQADAGPSSIDCSACKGVLAYTQQILRGQNPD